MLWGGEGQDGHQSHVPGICYQTKKHPRQWEHGLGSPAHRCLWGPARPCLSLPPHLIVLSSGPLRSPAHSQVRTDASQGSELLLAGLPHTSSPQRASALQLVLSLSQADLHLPRGSSRFLQVPPPCFPQTAQAPSANTLELHGAVEIAWLWNLEAGFQFRRWVHEVLGTSFSIS